MRDCRICGCRASGSFEVGAGLYEPWMDGATDADGNPRVKGKRPDIGCYECQYLSGGMMLLLR